VLSRSEINEILLLQVVTGVGRETSSTRPRSDVWNYFLDVCIKRQPIILVMQLMLLGVLVLQLLIQ
jgi:hypothetical protein